MAASAMTETVMPPEMLANLKVRLLLMMLIRIAQNCQPDYVAPFVAAVCHPNGPDASGRIFEVGAGYIAEIRWERSKGSVFKTDKTFTPSAVSDTCLEIVQSLTLCLGAREVGADH